MALDDRLDLYEVKAQFERFTEWLDVGAIVADLGVWGVPGEPSFPSHDRPSRADRHQRTRPSNSRGTELTEPQLISAHLSVPGVAQHEPTARLRGFS